MRTRVRLKKKLLNAVGANLKYYRNKKGITQENLAFVAVVDRTYIGAIEQGTRSPSIYCLFILASALDVKVKDLLDISID